MKGTPQGSAASDSEPTESGLDPANVSSGWWRYLAYGAALSVFLALRVFVWSRTSMVEDHDSLSYLLNVDRFASRGVSVLTELGAGASPMYPLLSGLLAPITSSSEQAARLCSLLASVALFFAVLKIGSRLGGFLVAMLAVTILTFNPIHIPLSVAVLSEPTYLAFVYWGIWLLLGYTERPRAARAFAMGLLFSLAFLSRPEGFLFVLAIPLLLLVYFYLPPRDRSVARRAGRHLPAYLLGFAILAAPQVWKVSSQVGGPAINGRQILIQVVQPSDIGPLRDARLLGLDYDPYQLNIGYLMAHPEARERLMAGRSFLSLERIRLVVGELDRLYRYSIGRLLGLFGVAFFALGCAALLMAGQRRAAFLVIGILATMLVGPLGHNVAMRHIVVVAPLAFVVEGVGIAWFATLLAKDSAGRWQTITSVGLAIMMIAATVRGPLRKALDPPTFTGDYSLQDLKAPTRMIQEIAAEEGLSSPSIAARQGFLAYQVGGKSVPLPYSDYDAMVRFLRFREADFLYLVHKWRQPFLDTFERGDYKQDFELIYASTDREGNRVELFRIAPLRPGKWQ